MARVHAAACKCESVWYYGLLLEVGCHVEVDQVNRVTPTVCVFVYMIWLAPTLQFVSVG